MLSALLDAVPQLSGIHQLLLTDHWLGFGELLRSTPSTEDLLRWSGLAYTRFTTKDITS